MTTASSALWPFSGKKDKVVPVNSERESQELAASAMLAQARQAENAGRVGKAQGLYQTIVKRYAFTPSAAEASFQNALIIRQNGKMDDAFDAFQTFILSYRDSPHFSDAIEKQYEIAEEAKGGKKQRGMLLISMKMNSSEVIKFYEKIIKNAPFGKFAPLAQFSIAEIQQDLKEKDKAVEAYNKVVENYPNSSQAAEAQFRIGSISNIAAQRSEDASNLLAARDALRTYIATNPAGERKQETEMILNQVNTAEANQSLNVAKYYQRVGKTPAAAIYLNEALKFGSPEVSAEARTMLAELAAADPEGVSNAKKGPGQDYTALTAGNLKTRDDYVGPLAPELARLSQKPRMRTGDEGFVPIPLQEPTLPLRPGAAAPGAGSLLPPVLDTEKPALLPVPPSPSAPSMLQPSPSSTLPVPPAPSTSKPAS
ncbi:tetratricopeptide repeat protein [Prosthecobacter sp.]|uniref:tetratricopeptide repeat protein n=1 Tax=Prosthecobacter sp. TaxID=1965333 RepID=UPI00248720A4|nr:tetratricopeptide repeat protein [Prosthecobacter sp.]MDI1312334.1 tetratricopeptide repeat protein [Prosthecobacter sp.]